MSACQDAPRPTPTPSDLVSTSSVVSPPSVGDQHSAAKRKLFAEDDMGKLRVIRSENDTIARKYLMSVLASFVAEGVTYPLDLTKTRLQLQGEVAAGDKAYVYRGMIRTAFGVVKEEVSKKDNLPHNFELIHFVNVWFYSTRGCSCFGEVSCRHCTDTPSTLARA